MADQLYLSYWLNSFSENNMLRHWEKLLRLFPYSRLWQKENTLRVIPVNFQEPAILEQAFPHPPEVEQVLAAAKEFRNADTCYRFETAWDLWQFEDDWKVGPARVALCCYGPEFEHEPDDQLGVDFGIDTLFLPQSGLPGNGAMIQSNVKSLLKLVHDLDDGLAVKKRLLWTETGENFAEKLKKALQDPET